MKTTAQKIWEEGKQEGREEGREEGKQEGEQKGIQKGIQKIAMRMYEKGTSMEKITELTDLSSAELKELLLNHHKK